MQNSHPERCASVASGQLPGPALAHPRISPSSKCPDLSIIVEAPYFYERNVTAEPYQSHISLILNTMFPRNAAEAGYGVLDCPYSQMIEPG
jgi:hypothetical protein